MDRVKGSPTIRSPRGAIPEGALEGGAAEEEAALRRRVRDMRLQRLADEVRERKIALVREGSSIRNEIARLRAAILQPVVSGASPVRLSARPARYVGSVGEAQPGTSAGVGEFDAGSAGTERARGSLHIGDSTENLTTLHGPLDGNTVDS